MTDVRHKARKAIQLVAAEAAKRRIAIARSTGKTAISLAAFCRQSLTADERAQLAERLRESDGQ